jgi:hypothetical protein
LRYCTSQCPKLARNLSWLFWAKHGVNAWKRLIHFASQIRALGRGTLQIWKKCRKPEILNSGTFSDLQSSMSKCWQTDMHIAAAFSCPALWEAVGDTHTHTKSKPKGRPAIEPCIWESYNPGSPITLQVLKPLFWTYFVQTCRECTLW